MIGRWRRGVRAAWGLITRRPDAILRDADAELASVVDERVAHLVARGMAPEAAHAEAVRRLGGSLDQARERLHRSAQHRERVLGAREWAEGLGHDLRYAARGLAREPLFSAFAVVTLALGIGANAAMFRVVDKLLLGGPAHVRDPERVVRLYWSMQSSPGEVSTTAAFDNRVYANLLVESHAFAGLAMETGASLSTVLGRGTGAHLVWSALGTSNLMSVLGTQPAVGRFFTPDEQDPNAPGNVVVLGFGIWQSDFGADRDVVGRTISIDARPYTVVGVAPKGFTGAELGRVDLWFPLPVNTGPAGRHWGRGHMAGPTIVGRLRPGTTRDQAGRDATLAYQRSYDGGEQRYAEATISAAPLHYGMDGTESTEVRVARWLAALSGIVLLVACANLANLLLARAVHRRREIAVRVAMGVGRGRLVRLLLASSVTLAVLGAAAGLAVAYGAGALVRNMLLPDVDWTSGLVDGGVLLFSLVTALGTGVLIGVLPAWRAGRRDVVAHLKAGVREGGGRRSGARVSLMVAQAALAMVLLVGAGLFVRSLNRVRHLDLGLQPDSVLLLRPRWPPVSAELPDIVQEREGKRRERFARDVVEQLAAMPQVEDVAAAVGVPFRDTYGINLRLPGRDSLPQIIGGYRFPDVSAVSDDYFRTVGTRLVRGRLFTGRDRAGSEPVAVVGETMARVLWPGERALGQCLLLGMKPACTRVVGVVQDVRRGVRAEPVMHYYLPLEQQTRLSGPDLLVRPRGSVRAAIPALRARLRRIDPTVLFVDASTLQEAIAPEIRSWRVGALMFSLFALLAVVVASLGMFSVVAYLVEQRRHEIGVRVALGAGAEHVVGLVLRGAVGATCVGVMLGAVLALAGGRLVEPLLFQTSARDPVVLALVAGILLVAACAASMIPALRARRVDPVRALRSE